MRLSSSLRSCSLFLCVALAACAGATGSGPPGPTVSGPAADARGAVIPGMKKEWWQEGPMTREKASSMCWMKSESRRDLALEARADFVNKCVAETLKGRPPR